MQTAKRTLAVLLMVGIVTVMGSVVVAGQEVEFDVLSASKGTETFHWWEEVLWKADVDMTGKKIEFQYVGTYVLINYLKFVNVETGERIIFTDFENASPADRVKLVSDVKTFSKDDDFWAIRTDHMGDVGGKSLHAVANQRDLPNLIYDLGLTGRFSIYVGMRATDFPNTIGIRLVD